MEKETIKAKQNPLVRLEGACYNASKSISEGLWECFADLSEALSLSCSRCIGRTLLCAYSLWEALVFSSLRKPTLLRYVLPRLVGSHDCRPPSDELCVQSRVEPLRTFRKRLALLRDISYAPLCGRVLGYVPSRNQPLDTYNGSRPQYRDGVLSLRTIVRTLLPYSVFNELPHSVLLHYSDLTTECQNCVVKSREMVATLSHKIGTTLSKSVYATLNKATLLTKNGVMSG
jgi:hypothetical protein